ncbi:type ISP restriction/modification enzyme [Ginsengibacter hankyongi]|uniref:type ISP restriction/modification enzyme n=1 Tax=Ginsengibacter hankyongi TaxID=2607284 RepID=UPI002939341C|nr:type ISP restriction/modification enzyme [Ginsengibacter hankyongi]
MNAAAAGIADHHEKQKFLKVVYETFYKSYNPKAADRLGVVYTPNEIVKFMIESTDYLLNKHFGKFLEDKGVEILDPATGTGTFICDIIDYLRKDKLEYKYKNEMNANEVAILPYYISNLNIEFTYTQKMGKYSEFENLCFVDTLDNMGFKYKGKQFSMFEPFTEENSKRIYKQNTKNISVIIGNPPYNANQANENDNNKNRQYPEIDKRIKDTFIKYSNAHKTKVYDMYARFYRWAFDRLDNNGIISFVTNRSFIDSRTFDGFRKCIQEEFDYAYIIDTKSDVRTNPKIAGTTHNIFGIQTGVAIMFLVKKFKLKKTLKRENNICQIQYYTLDDFWKKEEKLQWFTENSLQKIGFEHIQPDKNNNWINLTDNDWRELLPIVLPKLSGKVKSDNKSIFDLASFGTVSNRDEWVYDFEVKNLTTKVNFYIDNYNSYRKIAKRPLNDDWYNNFDKTIKWTQDIRQYFEKDIELFFDVESIITSLHRPFVKKKYYYSKWLNWSLYKMPNIFKKGNDKENVVIAFLSIVSNNPLACLASNHVIDLCLLKQGNGGTQSLPLYKYDEDGNRLDNITEWGLNQFIKRYGKKDTTRETIFYYVYAVLHNPDYRKKYELNLKREFPRIPFYKDFKKWSDWGKALLKLHLDYETIKPFGLTISDAVEIKNPKCKLKTDKENNLIILDERTTLSGIPAEAWNYKLGNRSALEWVLDQYKEKKYSDPTIAEKFNTYKFSDYKEHVIDLLTRVCTVSVETMKIINEMKALNES